MSQALTAEALPSRDVIDRLPPEAQIKLANLRDQVEQAFALQRAQTARVDEARKAHWRAADALQRLEAAYAAGHVTRDRVERKTRGDDLDGLVFEPEERVVTETRKIRPDEARLARERADVARLKSEWDRQKATLDSMGVTSGMLAAVRRNLEAWLGGFPAGAMLPLYAGRVKTPTGELLERATTLRTQILALCEEAEDVRSAPFPADEIKARLHPEIDALARRGRPDIAGIMGLAPLAIPTKDALLHAVLTDGATGVVRGSVDDGVALVAWLFRDELVAKIDAEIDAAAEAEALTMDERQRRLADLCTRQLAAEREECATIEAAAAIGTVIMPRPNVDPRAFFNLSDALPATRRGAL